MKDSMNRILRSMLGLGISAVCFAVFVGLGALLRLVHFGFPNNDWAVYMTDILLYAAIAGFTLHLIFIIISAFTVIGNHGSIWWMFMILNGIGGCLWPILAFFRNTDFSRYTSFLVSMLLLFFFMYTLSFFISSVFLPKEYRGSSNPVTKHI